MRSPYIGKVFAVVVIVLFLGWSAVHSIGLKPAEPKFPFPKPTTDEPLASAKGQEKVVLAGGCFWGVEAVYDHTKGVVKAVSGYSGGHVENPGYEMVSTGLTGHAESVEVTFDPSQISFGQILMIYFSVAHDPTTLDRQGPDRGTSYRSAIFPQNAAQRAVAAAYIAQLGQAKAYPRPIVTKIETGGFYPAEAYHQHFFDRNPNHPYIVAWDKPKVAAFKAAFPALAK